MSKTSDPNEKNALAPRGAKDMSRGWNPFLIRTACHWLLKCYIPEELWARLPNNKSEPLHFIWISIPGTPHRWTNSYEFLYLGPPTINKIHMNFFTWDTLHVNKFIWFSFLGIPRMWTTSYEFLHVGTHVSLIACLCKNQKSKGRKYPSKGQNCPGIL